jgi:hypothetical protein
MEKMRSMQRIMVRNLNGREPFGDVGKHETWIFKKWGGRLSSGFFWLTIASERVILSSV